jgi:hypothetical protein
MIDQKFLGRQICEIPREAFWVSFDHPDLPDDRYPGLVIASLNKVPSFETNMILSSTACDGFSIWQQPAAIKPLSIKPELIKKLTAIVEEEFTEGDLDYGLPSDSADRQRVIQDYKDALHEMTLTWGSCKNERPYKLRQALYPVDATIGNLKVLTTDSVDLERLLKDGCELCIYIVGDNCD